MAQSHSLAPAPVSSGDRGLPSALPSGRRLLLLGVAALLSLAAALAIGILLFGDFGSTEGRILGTTAMLAGYGLVSLPAAMLRDRGRLPLLAAAIAVLALAGAVLAAILIWGGDSPEWLAKTWGTLAVCLGAAVQTAALRLRRSDRDSPLVRRLFAISTAIAAVVAAVLAVVLWAELDSTAVARALGALLVLDVLLVALQPLLARARPALAPFRLRLLLADGEPVELELEAADRAAAAAQAIRRVAPHAVAQLEFRSPAGGRPSPDP